MKEVQRATKQWDKAVAGARDALDLVGTTRECLLCRKEFVFEQVELIDFDQSFETAHEMLKIITAAYHALESESESIREKFERYVKTKSFKDLCRQYYELLNSVQTQAHVACVATACDECIESHGIKSKKRIKKDLKRRNELLPKGYHLKVVK